MWQRTHVTPGGKRKIQLQTIRPYFWVGLSRHKTFSTHTQAKFPPTVAGLSWTGSSLYFQITINRRKLHTSFCCFYILMLSSTKQHIFKVNYVVFLRKGWKIKMLYGMLKKNSFVSKQNSLAFQVVTIFFSTSIQDMKTRCTSVYWNAREHKVANQINVLCTNELLLLLTPW